jgi:hypothetical protein
MIYTLLKDLFSVSYFSLFWWPFLAILLVITAYIARKLFSGNPEISHGLANGINSILMISLLSSIFSMYLSFTMLFESLKTIVKREYGHQITIWFGLGGGLIPLIFALLVLIVFSTIWFIFRTRYNVLQRRQVSLLRNTD